MGRLTRYGWVEIVTEIRQLWGDDKRWSEEASVAAFRRFQRHDEEDIRVALTNYFNEGYQTAPSPSKLMGMVMDVVEDRTKKGAGPVARCDGGHRWYVAAANEGADPIKVWVGQDQPQEITLKPGHRVGACRVCHVEQVFPPGRLLTLSEYEDTQKDEIAEAHA